ncbi:hypothetical protein SAMN05421760_101527 [Neptunomonas antarctica]|uniref:Uncharacterized protein n=1 Tax=Neptunomonas antarctica TaxID=619304 RepID=A0A1N7J2S1_9GAMM|nr:hypothetical protein SAMN05421760_101527 [Neptunomonas antarctica]
MWIHMIFINNYINVRSDHADMAFIPTLKP